MPSKTAKINKKDTVKKLATLLIVGISVAMIGFAAYVVSGNQFVISNSNPGANFRNLRPLVGLRRVKRDGDDRLYLFVYRNSARFPNAQYVLRVRDDKSPNWSSEQTLNYRPPQTTTLFGNERCLGGSNSVYTVAAIPFPNDKKVPRGEFGFYIKEILPGGRTEKYDYIGYYPFYPDNEGHISRMGAWELTNTKGDVGFVIPHAYGPRLETPSSLPRNISASTIEDTISLIGEKEVKTRVKNYYGNKVQGLDIKYVAVAPAAARYTSSGEFRDCLFSRHAQYTQASTGNTFYIREGGELLLTSSTNKGNRANFAGRIISLRRESDGDVIMRMGIRNVGVRPTEKNIAFRYYLNRLNEPAFAADQRGGEYSITLTSPFNYFGQLQAGLQPNAEHQFDVNIGNKGHARYCNSFLWIDLYNNENETNEQDNFLMLPFTIGANQNGPC